MPRQLAAFEEFEAVAEELAKRSPAPSPDGVFAELVAAAPKRRSPRARAESIRDGGRVLFQLSAHDGRYGIKLNKHIDKQLRKQLQQDLKDWLRAWLKDRAPGTAE